MSPILSLRAGNSSSIGRPTISSIRSRGSAIAAAVKRGDVLAAAQDGDPVGDAADLVQTVRDEQNGRAIGAKLPNDVEKRGRLVSPTGPPSAHP